MRRSGKHIKTFVIIMLLIMVFEMAAGNEKEAELFNGADSFVEAVLLKGKNGQTEENQISEKDDIRVPEIEDIQEPKMQTEWIPEAEVEEGSVYYGYDTLNKTQKQVYRQILDGFRNRKDEIPVTPLETDSEVFSVLHLMLSDRPEIFWYGDDGSYLDYKKDGETVTSMTLKPSYSLEYDEIVDLSMQMEGIARAWIMEMPQGLSDYEKAKFMYEKLLTTTRYKKESLYNQDIRSVFLNQMTVCTGYAKAFQYLMQLMDIPCCMVQGVAGDDRHAWNLIQLNGIYYYVDVTWGLPGGDDQIGIWDYMYLCRDETFFARTHVADETVELPYCTDDSLNYYRQRNCYYEMYWDEMAVRNILGASIREGKAEELFVFNDEASYLTAKEMLFNTGMIEEIVQENYIFQGDERFEWQFKYRDSNYSVMIMWTNYAQD